MNAPSLIQPDAGAERCVYCGQACGDAHKADVKKTWSDWPGLANPAGLYRCAGCVDAMDERRAMAGRDKPQKTRTYSWLVTSGRMTPATKGQIPLIRSWCVDPPAPPFAICIATSGQKQLLYRTPVNFDTVAVTVCMEGEHIEYQAHDLSYALDLADRISAACGKMVLSAPLAVMATARIFDYWTEGERFAREWSVIQPTPMGRLISFLALPKEAAKEKHASDIEPRVIPEKAGGSRRSRAVPEPSLFA